MSTPNPLVPQGSNLEQAARSKSTLSIAAFIVGAHAAVFLGLLLIGCNKEKPTGESGLADGQAPASDSAVTPGSGFADTNSTAAVTNAVDPYAQPVSFPGSATTNGFATSAPISPIPPQLPSEPLGGQAPLQTMEATSGGSEYTVKSGDIAYNIAKRNGISLKSLKEANAGIDLGRLKIGQKIQLPPASAKPVTGVATANQATEDATASATTAYTVKGGDTLTRIAKKYGTTAKAIRAANGLQSDVIKVGQKLKIPVKAAAAPAPVPEPTPASNPVPAAGPAPGYAPPPYNPAPAGGSQPR
jgi:LysM repeat protein